MFYDAQSCIDMPANVLSAVQSSCMTSINEYMSSSENPCGLKDDADCTADKSFISSSVWKAQCTQAGIIANPALAASCKALYSSFTAKSGNFKFTLKKSIVSAGGGTLGQIQVCPSRA